MQSLSRTLLISALAVSLSPLTAQWTSGARVPLHARDPLTLDSGYLDNNTNAVKVLFTKTLQFQNDTIWLQLMFHPHTNLPQGSFVRITSLQDGGVQRHTALSLIDWSNLSAYFNGSAVKVELVAAPNTRGNHVRMDEVLRGLLDQRPSAETICGVDNRVKSNDMRQGRLWLGCTGWLIGPTGSGDLDIMLSAGHCTTSGTQILEMNVPNSTSSGSVVRSAPNDQYPYTVLNNLSGGVGSDWLVAHVGKNSNTNRLPTQANGGVFYQLGAVPTSTAGQNIDITGYGTTSPRNSLSQVQKTHVGPLSRISATSLCYATDTTGGNSGSPVVHANTGRAIGIHTHGGCQSSGGGCNSGTRIDRSDLQAAIAAAGKAVGSFTTFGAGCQGTGTATCPPGVNTSGGTLSNTTTGNEYAYTVTSSTAVTLTGFEIFTASTSGSVTVNTAVYADNGGTPAATPVATGTMTIGATPGFYSTTIAASLPAGRFYIAVDHSAGSTYVSQLTSGSAGSAFWRRGGTSFSLSGIITRPSYKITCSGGGGGAVPGLSGTGTPEIGSSFAVNVANGKPNASAVLLLGGSNTTWSGGSLPFNLAFLGAPTCNLLVRPSVPTGRTLDGAGAASLSIPVPNVPAYVGAEAFFQWYVLDAGANAGGIAVSNGGKAVIGG